MDYDRELGEIHTEIQYIKQDVDEIKVNQKELTEYLHGAQGAWKALAVAGTIIISAVGLLATKLWDKIFG